MNSGRKSYPITDKTLSRDSKKIKNNKIKKSHFDLLLKFLNALKSGHCDEPQFVSVSGVV